MKRQAFIIVMLIVLALCTCTIPNGTSGGSTSTGPPGNLGGDEGSPDPPVITGILNPGNDYNNIAIGRVLYASSRYNDTHTAAGAADGDVKTAWGSKISPTPEWIYIDLGRVQDFVAIKLHWFLSFYARKYSIYISDDILHWERIYTEQAGNGGDDLFVGNRRARYIGVYCREGNADAYGLAEFEVYAEVDPLTFGMPTDGLTPQKRFDAAAMTGNYLYIQPASGPIEIYAIADMGNPMYIKSIDYRFARDIAVYGNYLYILQSREGVVIMDISDPENPVRIKVLNQILDPSIIVFGDDYAYIGERLTNKKSKFYIANISDPPNATISGSIAIDYSVNNIALQEAYAYVTATDYTAVKPKGVLSKIAVNNPSLPKILGEYTVDESMECLAIHGEYIYFEEANTRLTIVKSHPTHTFSDVARLNYNNINGLEVANNVLYVSQSVGPQGFSGSLRQLDVSNPELPVQINMINTRGYVVDLSFSSDNDYALIAQDENGVEIIDVGTPVSPSATSVCTVDAMGETNAFALCGDYAYTANTKSGFRIVDVRSTTNARVINRIDTENALDIEVRGGYAYVADFHKGLKIFDVRNPDDVKPVTTIDNDSFRTSHVELSGYYAYCLDYTGTGTKNYFHVIEIIDPAKARLVRTIPIDGETRDLFVYGNYAFVVKEVGGIHVIDISDPKRAFITFFIRFSDNNPGYIAANDEYVYITTDVVDKILVFKVNTNNRSTLFSLVNTVQLPATERKIDSPSVRGGLALAYNCLYVSGNQVIDIYSVISPENPVLVKRYRHLLFHGPIALSGNRLFSFHRYRGLFIMENEQ